MRYTVLVSVLGAIISAALALFGLHSWTALKFAPVIGASLGLLYATFGLRRYNLPLDASLEDYRNAAGISDVPKLHFWFAIRVGLILTCVELPSIMLGQQIALAVSAMGCVVVVCVTILCSWRQTNSPVKLDVFQFSGEIGCLAIFGWMTFVVATESRPWELAQPIPWDVLAKMIFAINGVVAILSAVLACFALAAFSSFDRFLAR
jgi:hypothetical protein